MLSKITPIILAGGQGLRLRPFTSEDRAKPFLRVASHFSLLQETIKRCKSMAPPIIVCDQKHVRAVQVECAKIDITPRVIIAEPYAKSTAPAIAAAVLGLSPDEIIAIMPSDHIIEDSQAFERTIAEALPHIEDTIISLAKSPNKPSARYGYIQRGTKTAENIYQSLGFHEKPTVEKAEDFLKSGDYMWNTGIFLTKSVFLMQKFKEMTPDIVINVKKDSENQSRFENILNLDPILYKNIEKSSIDVAVLEKCIQLHVTSLQSDWADVGTVQSFLWVWMRRLFATIKE